MKINLLFYTILALNFSNVIIAQDVLWERSYGGRQADYLADIVMADDEGFILAGSSLSDATGNKGGKANGNLDYWIWKIAKDGQMDWQRSFGGSGSDLLQSINRTPDGGYIIGGSSNSPISGDKTDECRGGNDYWIIKLNREGVIEWQRTYGGKGMDNCVSVIPCIKGGYLVGGTSGSSKTESDVARMKEGDKSENSRGNVDYWLIKIDNSGKIEWQKTIGGRYADNLNAIESSNDGGYLVGGTSNSPQSGDKDAGNLGSGNDYWILKLDKDGNVLWQKVIGGEMDDQLSTLTKTADGGFIVGGSSSSGAMYTKSTANKNGTDIWLLKYSETGNLQWQDVYDFGNVDILKSVLQNKDGSLMLAGYAHGKYKGRDEEGINDFVTIRLSATGEKLWKKTIGSEGQDVLCKAVLLSDGGMLLAGTSNPQSATIKTHRKGFGIVDGGQQLAGLKTLDEAIKNKVDEVAGGVNKFVDDRMGKVTETINNRINPNPDSRIKFGINGPTGQLLNPTKGGNAADGIGKVLSGEDRKPNQPQSRDKHNNYGERDFWVVRFGEKSPKMKKKEISIMASPNPVRDFATLQINYLYERGTVCISNMAGHELYRSSIESNSIELNFNSVPEGIYLVTVTTDKKSETIKIIKTE